jgi:hypothetical protein
MNGLSITSMVFLSTPIYPLALLPYSLAKQLSRQRQSNAEYRRLLDAGLQRFEGALPSTVEGLRELYATAACDWALTPEALQPSLPRAINARVEAPADDDDAVDASSETSSRTSRRL